MARLSSFYILQHPNTNEVLLRKIFTFTLPSDRLQKLEEEGMGRGIWQLKCHIP